MLYQSTDARSNGFTPSARLRNASVDISLLYFSDPDVSYNLENENELLASMDVDHLVRNITNNMAIKGEVSEEVRDENTEPSRNL